MRRSLVVLLLTAGPAVDAAERNGLVLQDGAARAELVVQDSGLSVALTVGRKSGSWKYDGLTLDPEETGAPAAAYTKAGGTHLLVVRAYSGGARCCWSLLAFDVARAKALGSVLESQSPIALVKGRKECAIAAIAEPVDRERGLPSQRRLHCFDGRRFRPRGS